MTEETWGLEGTAVFAGQSAANDAVTAGALLRRAREASGLHVAALAVSLKVPVCKLEALEEDRWDVLPDAVFVRALACSLCRTLKIDPQPVLDRLPQTAAPRLIENGEGINTPFRAPGDGAGPGWLAQLTKPVFLAVFALLLGALVLIFLPSVRQEVEAVASSTPGTAAQRPTQALTDPATVVESAAIVAAVKGPQALEAVAAPAVLNSVRAEPVEALRPLDKLRTGQAQGERVDGAAKPVAASSETGAAAAQTVRPEPAPDAAPEVTGVVVFKATQQSWVEVTDAKGVVPVRRLLAAGEAAGISGALPMQVIVGRADATEVQVRGKPFDLRPVSRDNVARFEVK
jgi:cytoskeleton protein RodZ